MQPFFLKGRRKQEASTEFFLGLLSSLKFGTCFGVAIEVPWHGLACRFGSVNVSHSGYLRGAWAILCSHLWALVWPFGLIAWCFLEQSQGLLRRGAYHWVRPWHRLGSSWETYSSYFQLSPNLCPACTIGDRPDREAWLCSGSLGSGLRTDVVIYVESLPLLCWILTSGCVGWFSIWPAVAAAAS